MYWYVIRMSLVCTRISSRIHSYVIRMSLVYNLYVTRMYSYVIRMSLYVLVCQPYVTRMWFYHEPFHNIFKIAMILR